MPRGANDVSQVPRHSACSGAGKLEHGSAPKSVPPLARLNRSDATESIPRRYFQLSTDPHRTQRYPQDDSQSWTPQYEDGHPYGMESNDIDVYRTNTTNTRPGTTDSCAVRIKRGFRASFPCIRPNPPRWEVWEAIALARIAAVKDSLEPTPVFVGSSALLLHGITGWVKNPDVVIHTDTKRRTTGLPAVVLRGVRTPPSRVSCRRTPPLIEDPHPNRDGFLVESPEDALLRVVMSDEQLPAFVLACMALHAWTRFSASDQESARKREVRIKARLVGFLEALASKRGTRRGSCILRAADAGCENPAEAALLWVVLTVSPFPVTTQHEIHVGGRTYFADIAIVDLKIIFEFDGLAKLGSSRAEVEAQKRRWVLRDEALRDDGWNVIRVCWADFEDFSALRRRIRRAFSVSQPLVPPPYAQLWALPSEDCDGPDRRIHSSSPVFMGTRSALPRSLEGNGPQSSSTESAGISPHANTQKAQPTDCIRRERIPLVDPEPPDWVSSWHVGGNPETVRH